MKNNQNHFNFKLVKKLLAVIFPLIFILSLINFNNENNINIATCNIITNNITSSHNYSTKNLYLLGNKNNNFPTPTSDKYINDYVGIVDRQKAEKIIAIGKELEAKTTAQASIVIINSTNNVPIEEYANKLFRSWGIGTKDKDNGLLILLAVDDKAWRVEVGRGLEGAVTDALSNRVMTSVAKPNFQKGDYGEGLLESYSAFSDYIASEYNVTLDKSLNVKVPSNSHKKSSKGAGLMGIIILGLIFLDLIFNKGRIFSTLLKLFFWSSVTNNHRHHGRGPGGFGGGSSGGNGDFGGGSSNGGGSSGSW